MTSDEPANLGGNTSSVGNETNPRGKWLDSADGLRQAKEAGNRTMLLLLDAQMPGMDGFHSWKKSGEIRNCQPALS